MATPLCVCDETRESSVCREVYLIDTARTPFHAFARHVAQVDQRGLLLNPFRGIPPMPGLPATEVVLLDRGAVVLECVAAPPEQGIDDRNQRVASALLLPASTIVCAQIQSGDQLRICNSQSKIEWTPDVARGYAVARQCRYFQDGLEADDNSLVRALRAQGAIMKLSSVQGMSRGQSFSVAPEKKRPAWNRLVAWATGSRRNPERRRSTRSPFPRLAAYYWAGKTPKAFLIGDIGPTGLYLITSDRWDLGTRIRMTLQLTEGDIENPDNRITVLSRVVRSGSNGVGFEFVTSTTVDLQSAQHIPGNRQSREAQLRFLQRVSDGR